MLDLSRVPIFRLRAGAVACDASGLTVGPAALLRAARDGRWSVRPIDEINRDLSACYGLPVDASKKNHGLTGVARALDSGNLALAGITSLLLSFPDPPSMEKDARSDEALFALGEALWRSGLLKDWDPNKHLRTGAAPNPGWFAPVQQEEKAPRPGWPPARANREMRDFLKRLAQKSLLGLVVPETEPAVFFLELLRGLTPTELNSGEDRLTAQWKANLDPPKTLQQLQIEPIENRLGYEQHHIVEQNPANVAKRLVVKFGRAMIDDPDNLVWAPRLKHEQITAFYNSTDEEDPLKRRWRDVVGKMDFAAQRAFGLEQMRKAGILQ